MFGLNLKVKSAFEVLDKLGDRIGTEETIIQLITDIFPVIKADIEVFFESQTFNENTKPEDFLLTILKWYRLAEEKSWSVVTCDGKEYIATREKAGPTDVYTFEGDMLEPIREIHPELYQVMVYACSRLYHSGVAFWDDQEEAMNLEYLDADRSDFLSDCDDEQFQEWMRIKDYYENKEPFLIIQDIKDCSMTKLEAQALLNSIKSSPFKSLEEIRKFCQLGIDMPEMHLDEYHEPKEGESDGDEEMPPREYIRCPWDQADMFYEELVNASIDDKIGNYGLETPTELLLLGHPIHGQLSGNFIKLTEVMNQGLEASREFYKYDRKRIDSIKRKLKLRTKTTARRVQKRAA
jgi:hypothetical protein